MLLLSRWGETTPRPIGSTALLWLAVVVTGLVVNRDVFLSTASPLRNEQHGMIALEQAIHRHRFGAISHLSSGEPSPGVQSTPRIMRLIPGDSTMLSERLQDLPEKCNPSTEEYATTLKPFCNNENSLLLINQVVLAAKPDVTLAGMIQAHMILKAACLAVFAFFLLRVGFSPIFTLAAFHVSLVLVRELNLTHPISMYPFMLCVSLLLLSLLGLSLSFGLHRDVRSLIPTLLVLGFVGGFMTHLRSSYFPIVIALTVVYTVVAVRDLRNTGASPRRTGLLATLSLFCFFAGYKTFTVSFIAPIERAARGSGPAYGHHVIGHPLVLFLAVPPNDLAQREGIEYEDGCGLTLAQRIEPSITYLGPNYDNALFVYYLKLWFLHTDEMLDLYRLKFQVASATSSQGVPLTEKHRSARLLEWCTAPLRAVSMYWGVVLLVLALGALTPLLLVRRLTPGRAYALGGLGFAGLLLFIEQGMFHSPLHLVYHLFLYFWVVFLGLLCYQGIVDGLCYVVGRLIRRLRVGESVPEPEPVVASEPAVAA